MGQWVENNLQLQVDHRIQVNCGLWRQRLFGNDRYTNKHGKQLLIIFLLMFT